MGGTVSKGDMSKVYRCLGLMSGTSLDGVDVAIIETDGDALFGFGAAMTIPYTNQEREDLSAATRDAVKWNFIGPKPNSLGAAQDIIDGAHIRAVRACLAENGISADEIDLIGYHGQTMLHDATRGKTLQIGDGWRVASEFGVPCVYDFRSEGVAKGGQGAPLAPIYHKALVRRAELDGVTVVLNLGGVGNVTVVNGDDLLASDTGPANGPLDSFLGERGLIVDDRGSVSERGVIDFSLVDQWLDRSFFKRDWPRSADRHDFDVWADLSKVSTEDGAATLCAFTARSVVKTLRDMGIEPDRLIVCGGGRHNRTIMTILALEFGCDVAPAERYGWDSDAIEAQAFGYLAARVMEGLPNSFPTTTGVSEPTVGGRVVYPR